MYHFKKNILAHYEFDRSSTSQYRGMSTTVATASLQTSEIRGFSKSFQLVNWREASLAPGLLCYGAL